MVRALRDEDVPILLCGRSALDYQGEYTGSIDVDILIGTGYRGALPVLDAYVSRGDLDLVGAVPRSVARFLVGGTKPVDVLTVSAVHANLFDLLRRNASTVIELGSAGKVRAVTREGYFVLAVMIGRRGFARDKEDPMSKVREAWELFGKRTDRDRIDQLLERLDAKDALAEALRAAEG